MADNIYEQVFRGIEIEIGNQFEKSFAKLEKGALKNIRKIIEKSIKNSIEYRKLTSNDPAYHQFGIPDIASRLNSIINIILDEVKFYYTTRFKLSNLLTKGGTITVKVTLLDLDFGKILNSDAATYETPEYGYQLDWLQWLILDGEQPVIMDYHYKAVNSKASRTGFGIMVPRGSWSVPPSLSGTPKDNWITRSIDAIDEELSSFIEQSIADAFGEN